MALWRSYRLFRGECSHSTWIYRVALHTCLSFVRRRMRRPPCVPLAVDLSADDDSGSREQLEELYAMISRLGRLDRAVVLLWLEECSYDEIARITGLTRQNVGVRLTRIREKLRMMTNG